MLDDSFHKYMDEDPFYSYMSESVRREGFHLVAGRGSGKSRFLGRRLLVMDYLRGVPMVVFDNGDTIDNFIDQMMRIAASGEGEFSLDRFHYVDMSGSTGWITPFPLYYRLGDESLFTISQRFLEVVRRIDPDLISAPVQGYNPLWMLGTHAGKVLAALNKQITEMGDLLMHSKSEGWLISMLMVIGKNKDLRDSVQFFQEQYPSWTEAQKMSLYRKLTLFTADDTLRAIFGASTPGIDWQKVIDERQAVFLDFRHVHNEELYRFLMLWVLSSLRDFLEYRGSGNNVPLGIVVDELSSMFGSLKTQNSLLVQDLDYWLNTLMRRFNLWVTFAHQDMTQFSPEIQDLLLGMGTQFLGRIDNMDSAMHLAKSFFEIDPLKQKRLELKMGYGFNYRVFISGTEEEQKRKVDSIQKRFPTIVLIYQISGDYYLIQSGEEISELKDFLDEYPQMLKKSPVEYTIPEQHYMTAYDLTKLAKFNFFICRRGWQSYKMVGDPDDEAYFDPQQVEKVRAVAVKYWGFSREKILASMPKSASILPEGFHQERKNLSEEEPPAKRLTIKGKKPPL